MYLLLTVATLLPAYQDKPANEYKDEQTGLVFPAEVRSWKLGATRKYGQGAGERHLPFTNCHRYRLRV